MATYKASSHYEVANGNKSFKFDWLGNYETDKADEIKALDALVPTWIKRMDEPVEPEETPESEPEKQTEAAATDAVDNAEETPKPTAKGRKSSGK